MTRFKHTAASFLASLVLVFSISTAQIVPITVVTGVTALTITQTACGPDDLSQLHDILLKTTKTLNTAIKTNGNLYEQGFYGTVGSPEAVAKLHKGAQIIKDGALHLKTALTLAQGLTRETFETGKLAVLKALADAVANMPLTGAQTLDLVLQSVGALVNQAVAIIELFQASDVRHLRHAMPQIAGHIRAVEDLLERTNSPLEVFAE